MILNEIKEKLQEIDQNVFYGMVDDIMRETVWDYIVFGRKNLRFSTNKTGCSKYFTVSIIRENFIPDGLELDVIRKVLEIDGMRVADQDGTYEYIQKPNTNVVVELFSIDFVKPEKVQL